MGSPDFEHLWGNRVSLQARTRLPAPPSLAIEALRNESASPTLSDIPENTGKRYFGTLYLVKRSLAYFAKSPLSHAQAAICGGSSEHPTTHGGELTISLRSTLLFF